METGTQLGQEPKLWNKFFLIIALLNVFISVSMQFYSATMSLYVQSMGGSASLAGIVLTVFTISSLITRMVVGRAVDKIGRRVIALLGIVLAAVSSLLYSFFPYIGALPFLRFIQGAGYSMSSIAISVAITDVIPKKRLGEGIGYFGLSMTIASAVGPGIALALIAGGNFNPMFYIGAGVLGVAFVLMFFTNYEKDKKIEAMHLAEAISEEPVAPENEPSGIWKFFEKSAIPCSIISIFISIALSTSIVFLTLYAKHRGIENAGLFFTISALFMFVSRIIAGKITDKYGPLYSLVPGFSILIIGYILLASSGLPVIFFFIAAVFYGIGGGITSPTLNSTVIKAVPVKRRGAASATFFLSLDVGMAIGSVLGGIVIDHIGFETMFAGSAASCAIAIVLAVIFLRQKKQKITENILS